MGQDTQLSIQTLYFPDVLTARHCPVTKCNEMSGKVENSPLLSCVFHFFFLSVLHWLDWWWAIRIRWLKVTQERVRARTSTPRSCPIGSEHTERVSWEWNKYLDHLNYCYYGMCTHVRKCDQHSLKSWNPLSTNRIFLPSMTRWGSWVLSLRLAPGVQCRCVRNNKWYNIYKEALESQMKSTTNLGSSFSFSGSEMTSWKRAERAQVFPWLKSWPHHLQWVALGSLPHLSDTSPVPQKQ